MPNVGRRPNCIRFYSPSGNVDSLTYCRLVFVHDPTDSGDYVIPIGKQTLHPSHIFYTPCSGIWQSVWIEQAPANYVTQLDVAADMHGSGKVTEPFYKLHGLTFCSQCHSPQFVGNSVTCHSCCLRKRYGGNHDFSKWYIRCAISIHGGFAEAMVSRFTYFVQSNSQNGIGRNCQLHWVPNHFQRHC